MYSRKEMAMRANIYLIEDHPLMQKMFREFLERVADLQVCSMAASAQEALAQLPTAGADLVLIDISLPDMSSIDLLAKLQATLPTLPCLILSGHQEAVYVQRSLAAGAKGYVAKGNPMELVTAIQQVLAGDSYLSELMRMKLGVLHR